MPVKHKIKARLYESLLTTAAPGDHIARIISEDSLTIRQICEAAVERGRAEMPVAALERATAIFLEEMAYQLCDGYAVNTGYFTAGAQIRGVFRGSAGSFDPDKHNILFQFNQGAKMRARIPDIELDILGIANSGSAILQVTDVSTGSINGRLTPGRNLKVKGSRIKVAGEAAGNGIFFADHITNASTRVPANDIVVNKASELIIIVPDLPAGSYHLEVVSQYSRSGILKFPKTAVFPHILTVE